MSITLEEVMQRARATGGRIVYEGPAGERAEVDVPPPADNGDYGLAYLDPPFPARVEGGLPIPTRLGNPLPFTPVVVTDDDLLPE